MGNEEDVVRKVQALWAKADDPACTPHERDAFVAKARELMVKHAIDEMVLAEASSVEEAVVLADILLYEFVDESKSLVPDQRMKLAHYIAMHHRCTGVITSKKASVRADGTPQVAGKYMTLVGFRSDVNMTRLMYRNLGIDMITACTMEPTGHMTNTERKHYFMSFCDGYAARIERRLAEVDRRVEEMAKSDESLLPVLVSRIEKVQQKVAETWPKLKSVREKRYTFDQQAAERGSVAADNANLGVAKGIGGERKGIEQ